MNHTPTPWHVANGIEIHDRLPGGDTPNRICKVEYPYGEMDYRNGTSKEANAKFIVTACNSHDDNLAKIESLEMSLENARNKLKVAHDSHEELVEALKLLIDCCDGNYKEAVEIAEQALQKAGAK